MHGLLSSSTYTCAVHSWPIPYIHPSILVRGRGPTNELGLWGPTAYGSVNTRFISTSGFQWLNSYCAHFKIADPDHSYGLADFYSVLPNNIDSYPWFVLSGQEPGHRIDRTWLRPWINSRVVVEQTCGTDDKNPGHWTTELIVLEIISINPWGIIHQYPRWYPIAYLSTYFKPKIYSMFPKTAELWSLPFESTCKDCDASCIWCLCTIDYPIHFRIFIIFIIPILITYYSLPCPNASRHRFIGQSYPAFSTIQRGKKNK